MKLLLFDIDGTLLISKGAGRRSMQRAFRQMTGKEDFTTDGVDFSGRTDPEIVKDIFVRNGFSAEDASSWLSDALEAYVEAFQEGYTPDDFIALPGVPSLIEKLHETPDVQLAILTGNLETTAYLKLQSIGVDRYFPFGAFSSDHADRYQLPRIAVKRAYDHTGRAFNGKNVVIIGDTRHDILCGRDIDVFAVAVSTGHYSSEDLHLHGPDALLEDLSNAEAFFRLLT